MLLPGYRRRGALRALLADTESTSTGTRVVNCREEPYEVYIGRPSKWGNKFAIGKDGSREEVIVKYERWIRKQPELMGALDELRGKVLGCWCKPLACHGDVLVKLVEEDKPISGVLEDYGYRVDEATGEILSGPDESVVSKAIGAVIGPKGATRGRLAQKIVSTTPLSPVKRVFACVILAALAISIFLISIGVIHTPFDRIPPSNLDCTREWVADEGWVQTCE